MPLCFKHHNNLHELRGYFAGWDKVALRVWQNEQVERLQRLYAMAHPEPLPEVVAPRRSRAPTSWTVGAVLDLLRKEARHRPADVAAAFTEVADLVEHGKEF
jgi:hypothetical protein